MSYSKNIIISLHCEPSLLNEIILLSKDFRSEIFISKKYKCENSLSFFLLLKRIFGVEKYDFHFYNTSILNFPIILLIRIFGGNVIYYFHEPTLKIAFRNGLVDNIKSLVINFLHHNFFLLSQQCVVFSNCGLGRIPRRYYFKTILKSLPFDKEQLIRYLNNKKLSSKKRILFYGNINSGKNPFPFIRLFDLLSQEVHLKWELIVYLRKGNYNIVNSDHVTYITHDDRLTEDKILTEIAHADCVLLPHLRCTQSAIFEKATFLGKPIIFGPCYCFREFYNIYGVYHGEDEIELEQNLTFLESNFDSFKERCLSRFKKKIIK